MRARISWLVVLTTSTVVVSFVIPLCLLVGTLAEDRAMAAADQQARNVAILVAGLQGDQRLRGLLAGLDDRGPASTQVLTADGRQLGGGPAMAGDPEVSRALAGQAFRVVDDAGGRVLLPVVLADGTAVVRSRVSPAALDAGVGRAWAAIIGLGAVLLALALVIASTLGRRISVPLRAVAGTAVRLREGDLAARAPVEGTPETRELAGALNDLAERTTELLAHERAAVGDLSHRLRTPVTALRLDAEAVADPEVAGRLQEHVAVLQRTIDALVKEARRPVRTDLAPRCEATTTVAERVAFWRPLAEDQARPTRIRVAEPPLEVALAPEDLADLVDVLVDNVFAHTPEGTSLRVELAREEPVVAGGAPRARLVVADGGRSGTPDGRPPDLRTPPAGTGLGLDIARRTARGGGGSLERRGSPEGGTEVVVHLPLLG